MVRRQRPHLELGRLAVPARRDKKRARGTCAYVGQKGPVRPQGKVVTRSEVRLGRATPVPGGVLATVWSCAAKAKRCAKGDAWTPGRTRRTVVSVAKSARLRPEARRSVSMDTVISSARIHSSPVARPASTCSATRTIVELAKTNAPPKTTTGHRVTLGIASASANRDSNGALMAASSSSSTPTTAATVPFRAVRSRSARSARAPRYARRA